MPVYTFQCAASADNGYSGRFGATWPPGTADVATGVIYAERRWNGSQYVHYVGLVRFDTAALPDADRIISATLRLYCDLKSYNATDNPLLSGEYYSSANWPIDSTDHTFTAASTAWAGVSPNLITASAWNEFALTDPDSNINKAGYTGFRLHMAGAAPPTVTNILRFYGHATQPAELVITVPDRKFMMIV